MEAARQRRPPDAHESFLGVVLLGALVMGNGSGGPWPEPHSFSMEAEVVQGSQGPGRTPVVHSWGRCRMPW